MPLVAEISLGMSQYIASIIMPPLTEVIQREAPNIKLVVKNLLEIHSTRPFTELMLDYALSYHKTELPNCHTMELFSDEGVVIAPKKHKFWKQYNGNLSSIRDCQVVVFTQKEKIYAHPHLVHIEKKLHKSCRINVIVSDPFVAIQTAAKIGAVTYSSKRFAEDFLKPYNLSYKPLLQPKFPPTSLCWHEKSHHDPLSIWFRNILKQLFQKSSSVAG